MIQETPQKGQAAKYWVSSLTRDRWWI